LEVDGDAISSSLSHSYMVNGIIASGLGDDPQLNQIYKRQKSWQRKEFSVQPLKVDQLITAVDYAIPAKI
jgi:hypothetical protein